MRMKKLITLLLVLTGMVSTASADSQKILYLDAGVWSASTPNIFVYYKGDGISSGWEKFTLFTNHYQVLIPVGATEVELYRCNPANSYDPRVEGTTIIWDKNQQGNDNILWDCLKGIGISSYTRPYIKITDWSAYSVGSWSWVVAGSRHITDEYQEWNSSFGSVNVMTLTSGLTFTYTVSNKALKAGTYSYKYVADNDWRGDNGANYTVTINEDGVYDLTFTFDQFANTQSCTAAKTNTAPVTVEYKYYVKEENGAITGNEWADNLMTVSGNTASLTVNKALVAGTTYKFKIVEEAYLDGTKKNEYEASKPNTEDGYWSYTPTTSSTYAVTFNHYIPSDFDFTADNVYVSTAFVSGAYYFIINDGSWKVGDILTESESGIWTGTISNLANGLFALIPSADVSTWISNVNNGDNWNSVIRPNNCMVII
jgi:hypothetical protein